MKSEQSASWQSSRGVQPADSARVCMELDACTADGKI